MGYRELLKSYIRHVELMADENFIERQSAEPVLRDRERGELRTLAGEIYREAYRAAHTVRVPNFNYRLRMLMNRHELSVERVSALAGVDGARVRSWRTNPSSARYRPMTAEEYAGFESALNHWLETADR